MADPRVEQIFAATQHLAREERRAEVVRRCEGDAALEAACLRLLRLAETAGADPMPRPPPGAQAAIPTQPIVPGEAAPIVARAGRGLKAPEAIGPYRILGELGEGGFGVVYLAERREPMVQRVALKVIKPGMDSRGVIARFEQERQALAVMDHPNVARVLDGGVTPTGRPYFVMEHVKGEPITDFADRHRLTMRQRLELFIPVCEAVQHAHMKGIIHRDIKPSNILVAPGAEGAAPIVKVIDFGVAKAISHTLTEKTIFTERGQIIGTPEYMSPEQAEMGATDIDTRTDVYSLGAVLYELLSGTLPFDAGTLRAAGYAEIQRIIREVDAPRPSTRLSTADDLTGAEIAKARQADRDKIAGELRRELEWIPLKALRKDRARRYASAESLAADVRRYLDGRPLEAAPESRAYLLRKFVRRHRVQVTAGAAVVLALVSGFGTALWQAREAAQQARLARAEAGRADERADAARLAEADAVRQRSLAQSSEQFARRQEAVARAVQAFMNERLIGAIDPDEARGRDVTVREVVDRAIKDLNAQTPEEAEVEFELRLTLGTLLCRLGRNAEGTEQLRAALSLAERTAGPDSLEAARALQELGGNGRAMALGAIDPTEGVRALQRSIQIRSAILGPSDPLVVRTQADLEVVRASAEGRTVGQLDAASAVLIGLVRGKGESIDQVRAFVDDTFRRIATATRAGNIAEADRILAEEAAPFFAHPMTRDRVVAALSGFSVHVAQQGQHDVARAIAAAALRLAEQRSAQPTMDHCISTWARAETARRAGDTVEAERWFARCLELGDLLGGTDHPWIAIAMAGLGAMQFQNGKVEESEVTLRNVLAMYQRMHRGNNGEFVAMAMEELVVVLRARDKHDEALRLLEDAAAIHRRLQEAPTPELAALLREIGVVRSRVGRPAEAEAALLEAHAIFAQTSGESHAATRRCAQDLVDLYTQWDQTDPGKGHDQTAATWRARLPEAGGG